MAQATAPILDSTFSDMRQQPDDVRFGAKQTSCRKAGTYVFDCPNSDIRSQCLMPIVWPLSLAVPSQSARLSTRRGVPPGEQ